MNTLFDHSGTRETGLLTVIDGAPYILDTELVHIVPFSGANAVRWAAKCFLPKDGPHGAPLMRKTVSEATKRATNQVALTEPQAIFLARRAAIAFDKTAAVARISAAFAAYHALRASIPQGVGRIPARPLVSTAGAPDAVRAVLASVGGIAAPPAAAPDISAVVHAIGTENDKLERLQSDRRALDEAIDASRTRLFELGRQLPDYLKLGVPSV